MWTGLIFKSTSINISGSPNLKGNIKERKRKIIQKIKFNESFNQYNLKKVIFNLLSNLKIEELLPLSCKNIKWTIIKIKIKNGIRKWKINKIFNVAFQILKLFQIQLTKTFPQIGTTIIKLVITTQAQ